MPMLMTPLAVTAYTATSALGHGLQAQLDALQHARRGLRPNDFGEAPLTCWIGRVDDVTDDPAAALGVQRRRCDRKRQQGDMEDSGDSIHRDASLLAERRKEVQVRTTVRDCLQVSEYAASLYDDCGARG